jgi:hypothetical protein
LPVNLCIQAKVLASKKYGCGDKEEEWSVFSYQNEGGGGVQGKPGKQYVFD